MNALDRLLLEARTAALHHEIVAYRQTAARDADRLPRIDEAGHGAGKALAAEALRSAMRALERFGAGGARTKLAESISLLVEAIRAEPDRPQIKTERDFYWLRDSA
jgi:hypothetical protein